jgi:hypothetical protein
MISNTFYLWNSNWPYYRYVIKVLPNWSPLNKKSQYCYVSDNNVACWSINGFTHKGCNKFSDPRFLNEIQNKDIVCLLETHCSLEESLNLPFFKSVHLIKPKSARTNKRSGGISVYVKNNIRKGIKCLTHKSNDYIWLQLTREFFNGEKDIYVLYMILQEIQHIHILSRKIF